MTAPPGGARPAPPPELCSFDAALNPGGRAADLKLPCAPGVTPASADKADDASAGAGAGAPGVRARAWQARQALRAGRLLELRSRARHCDWAPAVVVARAAWGAGRLAGSLRDELAALGPAATREAKARVILDRLCAAAVGEELSAACAAAGARDAATAVAADAIAAAWAARPAAADGKRAPLAGTAGEAVLHEAPGPNDLVAWVMRLHDDQVGGLTGV